MNLAVAIAVGHMVGDLAEGVALSEQALKLDPNQRERILQMVHYKYEPDASTAVGTASLNRMKPRSWPLACSLTCTHEHKSARGFSEHTIRTSPGM